MAGQKSIGATGWKCRDITFSPTTGGVVGTTTNDNASAGMVGEYISSSVTNQGPFGNGVWGDLTSISLTAGDWEVTASCNAEPNGSTTFNTFSIGVSSNSGNTTTGLTDGLNYMFESTTDQTHTRNLTVTSFRISLSATTTYYFKARFDYSNGSPRTTGSTIRARRIR